VTGPIFDKELRVSSRRRRNYVLRSVYVLLLTVFVGVVWLSVAEYGGNAAFQQSRMAAAGKQIVRTVVLFQFIATQALAVIMLSTSISDEVYHRTLGLLMTTPVNSLQIVLGKVFSKLLQLILLLGITLPILAIVRLFGGVSLEYVLSSFCITLTAVIFAGSLSLFGSIENRRAYAVIIRTVFILGSLYFVLPGAVLAVWGILLPRFGLFPTARSLGSAGLTAVLMHLNPFYVIWAATRDMLSPGTAPIFSWPIHCTVMLGASALVLGRSVAIVRRVALRQATGQLVLRPNVTRLPPEKRTGKTPKADDNPRGPVKRVQGPPVVWKELRSPFIEGVDNKNSYIGLAVTVLALLVTYLATAREGALDENFTHVSYALLFVFMGSVFNIVFSATRITTEKESQTWPLLLATPLGDWDVLLGKAASSFRRCLPIWGLLAGHVFAFTLVGYIHPIAIFHLLIIVAWLSCFITGAGLYFSTRFRRTTSAVVASFSLALALWAVGPILAGLLSVAVDRRDPIEKYLWAHPAVQTELVMAGAGGRRNANLPLGSLDYGTEHVMFHMGRETFDVQRMTTILTVTAFWYVLAGLLFFWLAKRRLRRYVF
jgi:ABC-type transport system involved in multi-copper enzyme maturation permease subunit